MRVETNELRLSYSGANTWTSCRMKWYWNYVQNIRRKATSRPLQIGSFVHELLHRYYMDEALPDDMEQYVQEKYPDNAEGESLEVAREAVRLVQGYLERYRGDKLDVISSEMQIEIQRVEPSTSRAYQIYMIVDAVARDEQNRLWRLEHKTASRTDTFYLNGLRGGLQGGIYHYGLNKTMPEPVVGTIYNMLVKTKIPSYSRMPVLMQETLADRSVQTFDGIARQIFAGDIFPNANACFAYNHECDYLPLCNVWRGELDDQITRITKSFYQPYRPQASAEDSVPSDE